MAEETRQAKPENAALKAEQENFRLQLAEFLRGKGSGQLGCKRRNLKRKKA